MTERDVEVKQTKDSTKCPFLQDGETEKSVRGLMAGWLAEMEVKQTDDSTKCPLLQDEEKAKIVRAISDLVAMTGVKWINGLEFPEKFPNCKDNEIKTRFNGNDLNKHV